MIVALDWSRYPSTTEVSDAIQRTFLRPDHCATVTALPPRAVLTAKMSTVEGSKALTKTTIKLCCRVEPPIGRY